MILRQIFFGILSKQKKYQVRNYQVTVVGGATDIGQTVSFMLRTHPSVHSLIVYDVEEQTPGVALDLSHVPSKGEVKSCTGQDALATALKGSDLVIATGGTTRQTNIREGSLFDTNTNFIKAIANSVAKISPMPYFGIATEPINITVPMAAEIMKNQGVIQAKKLIGITGIDALRAQTIYAAWHGLDPKTVSVPVIGGHSEKTIVPLVSQAQPSKAMSNDSLHDYTTKVCMAEQNVMDMKKGWSPTISMAHSIVLFANAIFDALDGRNVKLHAFVENNDFGTSFFSGLTRLDLSGIVAMERYTDLSSYEVLLLERSIKALRKDVLIGRRMLEYA